MSIYIGNDLEDRLEALETENASLRKYNEYHQVVHEINHMSDLHVDSSFHKQSMKLVPWKGIVTGKTRRQTRKWLDEKEEEKNALESCDSPLSLLSQSHLGSRTLTLL